MPAECVFHDAETSVDPFNCSSEVPLVGEFFELRAEAFRDCGTEACNCSAQGPTPSACVVPTWLFQLEREYPGTPEILEASAAVAIPQGVPGDTAVISFSPAID